ncbi:MAG: LuxR C-terminal-related transcriptional regulator [Anaerolineales bacterium]
MGQTNLPVQLTSFIGRERELTEVERLLSTSRLVTLAGAGGCGKTRLALQVAEAVSNRYQDGVWLVALASLRDPALVPQLITKTLGILQAPAQPALESLLKYLQSKEMLLLLDNCEHMIDDCAQLAQEILSRASVLRILATSREPLAIAGETVYPLSGLAWPSIGVELGDNPQALIHYDAVRLLVERTRAVLPHFGVTPANVLSIVEICRRLDGLPLALELASARSNVLTHQEISERLGDRFSLLVSRQRSEPDPRHRTLRTAMDWSYDLLSTPEQVMLRRLSVVAGGCSLATAEAVCAGNGVKREQVLDLLSSLVNKSLVVAQTLQGGEARYHLLETIRQYAQEKLMASDEGSVIHDQHLQCFLELTEQTAPKLSGKYQQLWLNWLEGEYDNIRVALAWSLESARLESDRIEAGLRIAIALIQFWTVRDYAEEGLAWFERLIAQQHEEASLPVRVTALAYAAFLARFRGNSSVPMRYGREAAALAAAAGHESKLALALALVAQAHAAGAAGDHHTAFILAQQVLHLNRELGDSYVSVMAASTFFSSAVSLGKYDEVQAMLDEALPLAREAGDNFLVAMLFNSSGDLARCKRNYAQAQTSYEESLSLLRALDAVRDVASVLHNLGHTCLHLGEVERAQALFSESLTIQQAQRNTPGVAECLMGFAALASVQDQHAAGARLLAAAVALGGKHITSIWAATRLEYEHYLALVRARLSETEFHAAQASGRALSLEQAVACAQDIGVKAAPAIGAPKKPDDLTAREREVAARIAQGKSNGEIADELVVSKRTVETHIANLLSKLGYSNRAQIVRWAIQAGLVKSTE